MTDSGFYSGKHEPWHQKWKHFVSLFDIQQGSPLCQLVAVMSVCFNLCVSLGVCVQLFTEPVYVSQARRGGGEVPRSASASSADVSGQTNHQQRDGAREDEESRAADAATKPCSGETSNTPHVQPDRPWGCYILCRAACRHLGHRVLII